NSSAEEEPVNMTSMMDVVFNLLIFFLVATTMAQEEREINIKLPSTAKFTTLSAQPKQVIINIKEDGTRIVNTKKYDDASLRAMLAEHAKNRPDGNVLIRADERSTFRHFAGVVDLCRQVGIPEAKIGYFKQEG
ncbi:MAG: biopolymer transporter ExbD, partial [Actinobacteria bacterium]|nr:biopolymer transporter ExbD [Actinomycetota bacterium]